VFKDNFTYIIILTIVTAGIYYGMFFAMGSEDLLPEWKAPSAQISISIGMSAMTLILSIILTWLISLFWGTSIEDKKHFGETKFKLVFTIVWIFCLILPFFGGISS
jgi:cytochrome b561